MSAWNRRHGSDRRREASALRRSIATARRRSAALTLAAGLVGAAALALPAAAAAQEGARASAVAPRIRLTLAPPDSAVKALREHLARDAAWLARQPAVLLPPPGGPDAGPGETGLAAAVDPAGASAWADSVLQRLPPTAPDTATAGLSGRRDLLSQLRDRWIERGYLGVQLRRLPSPRVDAGGGTGEVGGHAQGTGAAETAEAAEEAVVRVAPGPQYRVGSLVVEGVDFPGRDRLLEARLPRRGDPFRPAAVDAVADELLAAAGETGHAFARWTVREATIDPVAATVSLTAVLIPGTPTVVGRISSDLASLRARRFVAEASGLRAGRPFRESDLVRARERLEARDLYADVGEPLIYLTSAADTVGVHLPVTPRRRANRLAVLLGYAQDAEGGGRVSGQVDLSLPNIAGTGRSLTSRWTDDGRDRRSFGFGYLEPLVLGTDFDTELGVEHEIATGAYTRFTVENRWQLPVVAFWGVELGWGWDRNTFPVGSLGHTSRLRGRVAFFHRRGSLLRSGWSALLAVEEARRESVRRTVPGTEESAVGTVENQRIIAGDVGGELWLGPSTSLSARAAYRQLTGGDEPAPLAEHFFFGGARSLRGYREDEFHGETVAHGGVELRLGRPGGSRVYTFVDLGYSEFASRAADDPETLLERSESPWGFGLGLQTSTPGGDISLAVGFPGRVDFDLAKLHVALMESF
ncbi:MAG: BamA/TamA family outer membrane protein [Candidatus Krumholzibacteriia bacterium]